MTKMLADLTIVVPLAVGLSTLVVVLAAGLLVSARQLRLARIQAVAGRQRRGASRAQQDQRDSLMALVRKLVQRLNVIRDQQGAAMRDKLAGAGWRSSDALTLYLFAKLALPLVMAGLAAAGLFLLAADALSLTAKLGVIAAVGLAASRAPEVLVKQRSKQRQQSIRKSLPDALDLLVICAEAGQSLDAALDRVSREIAPASRALAEELNLTLLELRFMPDRRRALENLAARVPLRPVQALVNTLFQTEKYGTPLAQALRVLAHEMREERMMRAEEKAARLPAIMTVPMIVFILPALFIVLLGPAIIDVMATVSDM